jgi:large subunit ribosomal protein L5
MDAPRLKQQYLDDAFPKLRDEFRFTNVMEVPRISKVVVNLGFGDAFGNTRAIDASAIEMGVITGQKPVVTRAKKSIANFKLREGNPVGLSCTLRGARMWEFLDRTINATLPRIRDFQGVSRTAFDGRGNFSLGLREQIVFPEIDYGEVDRIHGLQVNIITTARTDEEGRRLLELLGMPFTRTP